MLMQEIKSMSPAQLVAELDRLAKNPADDPDRATRMEIAAELTGRPTTIILAEQGDDE